MDRHIRDLFRQYSEDHPQGGYHRVIALHDAPDGDFEQISQLLPAGCRGWLELAQLPSADRIELVRDYWMGQFEQFPKLEAFLIDFFAKVEEIGIWVMQRRFDDPFCCQMVYTRQGGQSYFRGYPPATEEKQLSLQYYFSQSVLPADYLAFLRIHDGFAKTTDSSGLLSSSQMIERYEQFQSFLLSQEQLPEVEGKPIDPTGLIPFYESFGMPFYQCFWTAWHPEGEMGNVYYSGRDNTITAPQGLVNSPEEMAFATFADWLIFYLEAIGP